MPVNTTFLTNIYKQTEKLRLDILSEMKNTPDLPSEVADVPGAAAEVENGVLHISVMECLPRVCDTKGAARLRNHWLGLIRKALAGINISFKHALCVILIYAPSSFLWDVDNRAIKFILDALRYCRVIPDDTWNNLSYLVTGLAGVVDPKTEIYVIEMGNNYIDNILNMAKKSHIMST